MDQKVLRVTFSTSRSNLPIKVSRLTLVTECSIFYLCSRSKDFISRVAWLLFAVCIVAAHK
jgi:hypothetical protein